jgi:ferrous iron transport protein B
MSEPRPPQVALVGNPNGGKTTLFNALTGLSARTGNYPGTTVEHREGRCTAGAHTLQLFDLPGTYSLQPAADDEAVTSQAVLGELQGVDAPDVVIAVVDATRLERGLYITLEMLDMGLRPVVALTMTDALPAGTRLDVDTLAARLGLKVVRASGKNPDEVEALRAAVGETLDGRSATEAHPPAARDTELDVLRVAAEDRYARIATLTEGLLDDHHSAQGESRTDRIDAVVLHPVAGPLVMIAVFAVLFQALFTWSAPFMDLIDAAVGATGGFVGGLVPDSLPMLRSLLVDGVVTGVGNVVIFVPQIAALFLFLALLEDSGYLARAAFILDRLMARVGLSGRAFVPLLSGFACAVPALMATRAIGSERDRLTTILVTPLTSCSARLPVYVLILSALFADAAPMFGILHVGTVLLFALYALGIVAAIAAAAVFRRTLLPGAAPTMILELPPYRAPAFGTVFRRILDRVKVFLVDAGTVILAVTILLWGMFTFPHDPSIDERLETAKAQVTANADGLAEELLDERLAELDNKAAQEKLAHSLGGRLGHAFEPVIAPLGFNWEMGVAILASFAAREVFVSSLGLVYGLGDADEESTTLREIIRTRERADGSKLYSPRVGLSLLVFFALAMQCMSTLAATRRETRSYKWPAIQFGYMTALAWVAAFLTFHVAGLFGMA